MHPNQAFRGADDARNRSFARERGFGVLTMTGAEGPLVSHIPFVMSDDGASLDAHIVRSNPIWRALREAPMQAVMIVSGPDAYISPDWYETPDQVPTWNYIAVHLRGEVRLRSEARLRPHLDALSEAFERRLAPKPIWRTDKVDDEALQRMLRMIAPITMQLETVEGTWKLGQNKPAAARVAASEAAPGGGVGAEVAALAALMKAPPV